MNFRLLSKLLGIVAMLIGGMMIFSVPWAWPGIGHRHGLPEPQHVEGRGVTALFASMAVCFVVGGVLMRLGRKSEGRLFRKEAMAVVGLSWLLATVLGAMPYYFSGVKRAPSVRLIDDQSAQVFDFGGFGWQHWLDKSDSELTQDELITIRLLVDAGARGLTPVELSLQHHEATKDLNLHKSHAPGDLLRRLVERDEDWERVLVFPSDDDGSKNYRVRWIKMGVVDCLFESQSGFSTTGATVISDLEDPQLVPHCILFWRSSTHFLGGLGIIVLFVAILGQGSAGKALMRAEMPGPTKEGAAARMQTSAWLFAGIYCSLNLVLAVILWLEGLTWFDAICHAFGTMATGGFSTYNKSLGHFDSELIEYTVTVFMVLAGTNFTLLMFLVLRQPKKVLGDLEWRTYIGVLLGATVLIVVICWGSFADDTFVGQLRNAVRYGLFQVVSIVTTTGYGTRDFDQWNSFGRGLMFLLMFVGGCAGSTGGGMKVIRHVLFLKILRLEIEQSFHPRVVRPLKLGGKPVEDPGLRKNILVYFALILVIFVFSWLFVITVEPDVTWGSAPDHKLIDSASGVASTLNNIGPGLGTVGATQNYGHFSPLTKLLFVWLMMIGRLEIFAVLVLFAPGFWRHR